MKEAKGLRYLEKLILCEAIISKCCVQKQLEFFSFILISRLHHNDKFKINYKISIGAVKTFENVNVNINYPNEFCFVLYRNEMISLMLNG